jgi:Heat induced stress protein YflT
MDATAVGVFQNRQEAQAAIDALRRAGFRDDQIGMAAREQVEQDAAATQVEEGAGIGAAAGAAAGTGLGLAVVAGLMPPVGPIIAGGTLIALMASAGAGAAVGTVLGALVGMGVPEEEAGYYDREFAAGRAIVTVRADDRYKEAEEILYQNGALERRAGVVSGSEVPATHV